MRYRPAGKAARAYSCAMQPQLGERVDFQPRARPPRTPIAGRHVLARPLDAAADAAALWEATHPPLAPAARSEDPLFHTLLTLADERPRGYASYLRITPEHGVIEIGNIILGA